MKILQKEIQLPSYKRGFHLITNKIHEAIPELKTIKSGMINIFIKHTSASLSINENADPTVRSDFESFFTKLIPDGTSYLQHQSEGPDDMPAHIKASILGASISIPVTDGVLNLGTWQGVYLCEHRNNGGSRKIVITIYGED